MTPYWHRTLANAYTFPFARWCAKIERRCMRSIKRGPFHSVAAKIAGRARPNGIVGAFR